MFLSAGGDCALCGALLQPGWHGDHIYPYSRGGNTDVLNGQALCPKCNLRKGDKVSNLKSWVADLRDWQEKAFRVHLACEGKDFLVVATPGAGKTTFALRIGHEFLYDGDAERVVIVCPTAHLKRQWANAAAQFGINIDANWDNEQGREASDYHGMAVTYQQVASNPQIFRFGCRRKTLVILDEVHHAGDGMSWGTALKTAFDAAVHRLLLSGTPFRSDNNPIPFVSYVDRKSFADFSYGYGDALRDDVCRPIYFPTFEGKMTWMSGFDVISATFADALSQKQDAERLNAALNTEGNWLRHVIAEANDQLTLLRSNDHADAGGLIIAKDKYHAQEIAKIVRGITREEPTVATSDEPDASDMIAAFAVSNRRWIIAVKMVSEGVDIPRLRVGVYATNVTTEMFFRQAVGRFVRVQREIEEQSAWLYLPASDVLKSYAQSLKVERDHQLEEEAEKAQKEPNLQERLQMSLSSFISSDAIPDDVIGDETIYSQAELLEAENLKRQNCKYSRIPTPILIDLLRDIRKSEPAQPIPDTSPIPAVEVPIYEQKKALRKTISKMVARYANMTGEEYAYIHGGLNKETGTSIDKATVGQLQKRLDILQRMINEEQNAG